ncbi:MAG: Fe-S oxidoreductase [Thiotrichales bacterium]|nr:Fe-S oxidoreductase [Thiotrichales bacterium]
MSSRPPTDRREGSLEAPRRHPIDWQDPAFYNRDALDAELKRVFDICHGCRRCFNLCNAFPTLFDLVDESDTMEVDGVAKADYLKVVDDCYLCDMCFMTKCPYVPPHEWNVDFPHLMLRAKAVKHREQGASLRDKLMTSTNLVGGLVGRPVIAPVVNAVNQNAGMRKVLESTLGVHSKARLPSYHSVSLRRRQADRVGATSSVDSTVQPRVALFVTCYGNHNDPRIGEDLIAVYEHNDVEVVLASNERCCGMPKMELGDLEAVERLKDVNVPALAELVEQGYDLVGPIPSCVLMFKQELPLLFPADEQVARVAAAFHDPYEYLMKLHREGRLKTEFKNKLGKVAYQVACHQRVQNIGLKTREVLDLVPDTEIVTIERCSGHDGTYAVKKESHETSMKIAKPVVKRVRDAQPDYFTSDCAMAAQHIAHGLGDGADPYNPMTLLRKAYGI